MNQQLNISNTSLFNSTYEIWRESLSVDASLIWLDNADFVTKEKFEIDRNSRRILQSNITKIACPLHLELGSAEVFVSYIELSRDFYKSGQFEMSEYISFQLYETCRTVIMQNPCPKHLSLYESLILSLLRPGKALSRFDSYWYFFDEILRCSHTNYEIGLSSSNLLLFFEMLLSSNTIPIDMDSAHRNRIDMINSLETYLKIIMNTSIIIISDIKTLLSMHTMTFHFPHQGLNDRDIQVLTNVILRRLCPSLSTISTHIIDIKSTINNDIEKEINTPEITEMSAMIKKRKEKAKIGFLSSYLFDHSIGKMLVETIYYFKSEQYQQVIYNNVELEIELFVYFIHDEMVDDMITQFLRRTLGDRFILLKRDFDMIIQTVSSHELDFLVFTDIGMDFLVTTIAHSRLAIFQVLSLKSFLRHMSIVSVSSL